MGITIKDVATHAGVSLGTASRALSGTGSVAAATRQRVLEAADALNYVPNAHAGSLRTDRTATLGLLLPDVRNPYFGDLAHWLERSARPLGLSLLLATADENPQLMREHIRVLRGQRVDGIIAAPFFSAREDLAALHRSGMPLVFVDRMIPDLDVPAVISDTAPAIEQAVADLADRGAQRIGCISGPQDTSTGRARLAEVIAAASAHAIDLEVIAGDFQEASGHRAMSRFLPAGIDAVIAADSLMTVGAMRACLDAGLVPGRDIRLVGFDRTPATAIMRPALPLVTQDIEAMAAGAVARLQGRIDPAVLRVPARYWPSGPADPDSSETSAPDDDVQEAMP